MQASYEMALSFSDRADWTLSGILHKQALRFGQKVFLREPGRASYSYSETDALASRFASALVERDFHAGDRLLIYLDNCAEYILAWFGAARAGVVEVPINTEYFGALLIHCVKLSAPRGILVGANHAQRFADIADRVSELGLRFFVHAANDQEAQGAVGLLQQAGFDAEHCRGLWSTEGPLKEHAARHHELESILFTSGTTGPSKGVMISRAQAYFFSDQCVNLVRLTRQDVYMTSNTLFHANAQFLTTYPALIAGASVVLYDRFSPSRFSERLAESGATVTNFLGVMMDWVAKQPPQPSDAQSRLRCLFAVPTAHSAVTLFKERFGVEAIVECFGQTEICLPMLTPYGMARPPGAVGLAVSDWFDIRLADPETDLAVSSGEIGELQIRPREPWIVNSGYFGNPEATAESRRNLWLHTGDAMRQDDAGWFYFVDRFKDCLRRRGENISSYDVESGILSHPRIGACAAVGVPADEDAGEDEIGLFVVAAEGVSITPQEVALWADDHLPKLLIPRYIQVIDRFPTTPSGKIQKAELRKLGKVGAWDRQGHLAKVAN